jgi:hypothetical protein
LQIPPIEPESLSLQLPDTVIAISNSTHNSLNESLQSPSIMRQTSLIKPKHASNTFTDQSTNAVNKFFLESLQSPSIIRRLIFYVCFLYLSLSFIISYVYCLDFRIVL